MGVASNVDSFLLTDARVGIVGLGDLGRRLREMLVPFRCQVRVFDPWLAERRIIEQDCIPSSLDDLFRQSQVVFLFASATSENQGFIGERELSLMPRGSVVLVMSRAGIIDFDALECAVRSRHVRAGIDVYPVEPLPGTHLFDNSTVWSCPVIAVAVCERAFWRSAGSSSPIRNLSCAGYHPKSVDAPSGKR